MNVIADVAGQYVSLMKLIKKMPKDEFLFVGDLIDRGPDSFQVVEWVMNNAKSLLGNHEHMMMDAYSGCKIYSVGVWEYNGGNYTMSSHGRHTNRAGVDKQLEWMSKLPLYHTMPGFFISHATWEPMLNLEEACETHSLDSVNNSSLIWSRQEPKRREEPEYMNKIQLSGHNSQWGSMRFDDSKGTFAICLDDSGRGHLTGYSTKERKVYQVDYL